MPINFRFITITRWRINRDFFKWPKYFWWTKSKNKFSRAIYKDADIYLFDDPISSIEPINSERIFKTVLLDYLKNKTRISIKHEMRNIELFSKIIYLKNGKIMFCGSYQELIQSKIYQILLNEYTD